MAVTPSGRTDRDEHDQEYSQRCQEMRAGPELPRGLPAVRLVPAGQIGDQFAKLAKRLGVIAALEALLELGEIKPPFGVARLQLFCDLFAVCVCGAEMRVATYEAPPDGWGAHGRLLRCRRE